MNTPGGPSVYSLIQRTSVNSACNFDSVETSEQAQSLKGVCLSKLTHTSVEQSEVPLLTCGTVTDAAICSSSTKWGSLTYLWDRDRCSNLQQRHKVRFPYLPVGQGQVQQSAAAAQSEVPLLTCGTVTGAAICSSSMRWIAQQQRQSIIICSVIRNNNNNNNNT